MSFWRDVLDCRLPLFCSRTISNYLHRRAVPFTELTLWRIFDCLVDGISVLQYGNELVPDAVTTQWYIPSQGHEVPIVHFDLKPANSKLLCYRL